MCIQLCNLLLSLQLSVIVGGGMLAQVDAYVPAFVASLICDDPDGVC